MVCIKNAKIRIFFHLAKKSFCTHLVLAHPVASRHPSAGGDRLPPDISILCFPSLCSECLRHRYQKPLAFFILHGGVPERRGGQHYFFHTRHRPEGHPIWLRGEIRNQTFGWTLLGFGSALGRTYIGFGSAAGWGWPNRGRCKADLNPTRTYLKH